MSTLNERSRNNLVGVHPDLVRVVELAAEKSAVPFVVTEGLRNLDRQKQLVRAGKSWTLNSRHLTGHAVDMVDADDFGYDIPDLTKIKDAMFEAAAELDVPLEWGGDWRVRDTPHFQLPFSSYPASGVSTRTKAAEVAKKVATSKPAALVTGAVATETARQTATDAPMPSIPAPPPEFSLLSAWQTTTAGMRDFAMFSVEQWPWLIAAGALYFTLAYVVPWAHRRLAAQ